MSLEPVTDANDDEPDEVFDERPCMMCRRPFTPVERFNTKCPRCRKIKFNLSAREANSGKAKLNGTGVPESQDK